MNKLFACALSILIIGETQQLSAMEESKSNEISASFLHTYKPSNATNKINEPEMNEHFNDKFSDNIKREEELFSFKWLLIEIFKKYEKACYMQKKSFALNKELIDKLLNKAKEDFNELIENEQFKKDAHKFGIIINSCDITKNRKYNFIDVSYTKVLEVNEKKHDLAILLSALFHCFSTRIQKETVGISYDEIFDYDTYEAEIAAAFVTSDHKYSNYALFRNSYRVATSRIDNSPLSKSKILFACLIFVVLVFEKIRNLYSS